MSSMSTSRRNLYEMCRSRFVGCGMKVMQGSPSTDDLKRSERMCMSPEGVEVDSTIVCRRRSHGRCRAVDEPLLLTWVALTVLAMVV